MILTALFPSKQINPCWISNSGLWKVVQEAYQNGLENWQSSRESCFTRTMLLHTSLWLQWLPELVDHPPYSPDLAPSDCFLFPNINASQMVAELSSWKVHQGCSFWPIIWCFTHQCLGTTRLHTWPSSILCLHRWPSGHLRKPAIPVCWWLYTVCTNKICKRKGKCCSQSKQRSRENEGMGYQMEGYLWTHKM